MKTLAIFWTLFAVTFQLAAAVPANYESLKAEAEKFFSEKSFEQAHQLYASATLTNLPPDEQRWVLFRRADTLWRSQASTQSADDTRLSEARRDLEILIRDISREEDRDRLWAEVQESLGDFHWTRRNQQNWGLAWPHYEQALDWWAGARDLELARERYLSIVWRMARPPGTPRDTYYAYWGNYVPLNILENAVRIAQSETDKARAQYLIAMTIRSQGASPEQQARVSESFESALAAGRNTDWYDDALYHYAEWMMGFGDVIPLAGGGWRNEPNYPKALELFRRLAREFNKGDTRYYDQAQAQIKSITEPQLHVSVPNVFLPDAEIQYHLHWRNVRRIELALYPVELNRDVNLTSRGERVDWLQSIDLQKLEKSRSWSHVTGRGAARSAEGGEAPADYKPGNETLRLEERLKPGAYVLTADAAGKHSRELVLVTDAAVVLKTSGKQALVYFSSALDGSPRPNGRVKLWEQWWEDGRWLVRQHSGETDTNGIIVFSLNTDMRRNSRELVVSAIKDDRQAFAIGNSYWYQRESEPWKIYAFTDRPAYRPGESLNWKFIARRYDGASYSTPANQRIEYEITDPRGAKIKSDIITLNAFGSAWGTLELTAEMSLGEYRVQFWEEGRRRGIGNATLFRLEEYKLPEFKVTVKTPEEKVGDATRKKTFRLGDTVEAVIEAEYYFGGPVANASVEVVIHQSPYWRLWPQPRPFPWFYEDIDGTSSMQWRRSYGGDQILKRETLKTDAMGRVTVSFESTANEGQDLEYRIEARVTDASRREIIGNGSVRVTKQAYYVQAKPAHNLYRPQDKVEVEFRALDANDQPIETEGLVKVTRDFWFEIWLAPDNREVKGDELKQLRAQSNIWPPRPERPDQKGWRLKFRGYEHDDILTRTVKTDTNGVAEFSFTPEREGYYRIVWSSDDRVRRTQYANFTNRITAETTVWIANNSTTELGYRHDGVEVIVDKDTFRVGQIAPVMLVANTADRHVLFSVEGEDLYSYQLVHLNGTVKLIQLPVEEKHVPNIFLSATLVNDRQIHSDTKQVIVPPTKNFLNVEVQTDRPIYQPREEGTLTVTTRNDEGKPVSAEVALSLVDESVFYIQSDYAGDPRQFFFGNKRNLTVQMQSTFGWRSFRLPELAEDLEKDRSGWYEGNNREDRLTTQSAGYAAIPQMEGDFGGGRRSAAAGRSVNRFDKLAIGVPAANAPAFDSIGLSIEAASQMEEPEESAVIVRSDFRSTVLWQPDVKTDANGKAAVKVKFPDSTTSWKATARAVTSKNQFGIAETNARTRQPLIVRLQAPRFFVVGDTVTLSAVANNNTEEPASVRVSLESTGGLQIKSSSQQTVEVAANGEARVDWIAEVKSPGDVKLKVTGRSPKHSDAMERTFTAHEHGIEKFISKSGKARGSDITVKLDLPKERKAGSTSLTVQVTPSMAVTMLDALPYLIDYPYGCTEQTMSRFLPAVITAKTLRDLGLKPEEIMGRVFGGIETNFVSKTQPGGKQDLSRLNDMTKAGLERLYDFQHGDGGWGWWKEGESDHWMTAYVTWGLVLAREAGTEVRGGVIESAIVYLEKEIVEEESNPDQQAFMLHALAAYRNAQKGMKGSKSEETAFANLWNKREQLNAYTRALLALSAHYYGKTQEARTLIANLENGVKRDTRPDQSVLIKPESQNSKSETVLGTAHWGEDGLYWRWSEGGIEATAFALRALLTIDPTNKLVEPVSNWLIKNRRGAQWSNTRDTAIVILALNDYLRTSGELKADTEFEVLVNGSSIAKKRVSAADMFNAPSRFVVDSKLIKDANEIRIRQTTRSGQAPALYFAVEAKFFSLEEPIAPAGNEIFAKREYFKLVGRPTLLKGFVYDKEPLRDGDSVKSGERIETVLTIEAKNNYEYLLFEDLKPAGLEAVEIRSGESLYAKELKSGAVQRKFAANAATGPADRAHTVQSGETLYGIAQANQTTVQAISKANNLSSARIQPGQRLILPLPPRPQQNSSDYTGRQRWVYQELRDRKVALFIDKLPEGVWEIRYDARAEVPGKFHALPVIGHAMYVPEIRCNGEEVRIEVADAN